MSMVQNYPPFLLEKTGKQSVPVVLASPHSGTFYPERLFELTDLRLSDFQKYEDAEVHKLFSFAPAMGIPLLSAVYGRAWVDLNRHPLELDPSMFMDLLPPKVMADSIRVKKGYGVIARQINPDCLIYKKKLSFETEQSRLTQVHFPYHKALEELVCATLNRFGKSLLLDIHSMPQLPTSCLINGKMPDFVLGTGSGDSACHPQVAATAAEILRDMGFFVTVNLPYAGAYTTHYYGRPSIHSHAMQIEIARPLYWNEKTYEPSENFNTLWRKLSVFTDKFLSAVSDLPL